MTWRVNLDDVLDCAQKGRGATVARNIFAECFASVAKVFGWGGRLSRGKQLLFGALVRLAWVIEVSGVGIYWAVCLQALC